jgi:catechol 2,3-dioxygenase-like lactoylglutathione lyase family enzyme
MRISRRGLGAATIALAVTIGGRMTDAAGPQTSAPRSATAPGDPNVASVRYLVTNVDRAVAFYTKVLDFRLEQRNGAVIAIVSRPPLALILSGPGSSGARPMPDGRRQEPGGWNRIVVYVPDLDAQIQKLKTAGARFRNAVEAGPGGRQIQVDDPDGNPIELHEAPKPDK